MTAEGEDGTPATVDGGKPPTVGRYTVHVEEFKKLPLSRIEMDTAARVAPYVIDEIGRMKLLSHRFRHVLIDLMAKPSNFLATIALKGKGFIDQLKGRKDKELTQIARENRNRLLQKIAEALLDNRGTYQQYRT